MTPFAGHFRLRAAVRPDGRTALAEQSFRAPFHLSKPYWDHDTATLAVQVVNQTAGILAGDRLESEIVVDQNATLLVTTPSASRVFTMSAGHAVCAQRFAVGAHAWLEVSPEPLVPHRGSRYRQTTELAVAPGGGAFFVEQLQSGRAGHGEAWSWAELGLTLDVRLGADLVLRERFAHDGPELRQIAHFFGAGPTACFANAVLIGEPRSSGSWLERIRALHREGTWVGISALRAAGWSIKIVAADSVRLRQTLGELRAILASAFPRMTPSLRKI
jgi:urease accessory protein